MTAEWSILPQNYDLAGNMAELLAIHSSLAQILINRDITTVEMAESFLNPSLKHIPDPTSLSDLEKAAEKLADAVMDKKVIGLFGDYDADGLTSTGLFCLFMEEIGVQTRSYIPNRLESGYGFSLDGLTELIDSGAELIVTADCGSTDYDVLNSAKNRGCEVIVTDHHLLGPEEPTAYAFVNPRRPEAPESFKGLAGVGVIFLVLVGLRTKLRERGYFRKIPEPNMVRYLDLVALGTIADVAPITPLNRILIKNGLQELSKRSKPGLDSLCKTAGINGNINSRNILFDLAPRINAPGRMGSTDCVLQLLTTPDYNLADELALELDRLNSDRQKTEREVLHQANRYIKDNVDLESCASILTAGNNWHKGVLGIVASRLARKYNRPSLVLTIDGDIATGSGRSIESLHLYNTLQKLEGYLIQYGGHSQAAGLKIKTSNLSEFSQALNAEIGRSLEQADMAPKLTIDSELDLDDLSFEFLADLEKLAPFGPRNPEPVFLAKNTGLTHANKVGRDMAQLTCFARQQKTSVPAIGFDCGSQLPNIKSKMDVAFRPFIDSFRGENKIKIQILDLRPSN